MAPKQKSFLSALGISLALDQATKLWIASSMSYSDRITVIDGFFYVTHVRNPGAAFGMLVDANPAYRLPFFIGVSLVAVGIIVSFYRKLAPGDLHAGLTLGLILGGALGNLIDRIFRSGEVVDFLHFRLWTGYSWPDFNIADSAIVVGVALLLLELLASEGESRARAEEQPPSR
jgi:signal peptidase II